MHDDRDRQLQLGQNRQRRAETSPGADDHLDPLPDRCLQGQASAIAHCAIFAQQGAVQIDRHHPIIGRVLLRLFPRIAVEHFLLYKIPGMSPHTFASYVCLSGATAGAEVDTAKCLPPACTFNITQAKSACLLCVSKGQVTDCAPDILAPLAHTCQRFFGFKRCADGRWPMAYGASPREPLSRRLATAMAAAQVLALASLQRLTSRHPMAIVWPL